MPDYPFSNFFSRTFSLKYNFLANFLGSSFISVIAIILAPFYLRYIGVEAYGLIGFFTSFQAILSVLDLGLSTTINRELAINQDIPERSQDSRNLVRTLEIVYWGIALLIGIISALASPALARWVNPEKLSTETVVSSFVIMSIGIALQFPISLYSGGLLGLQKHVLLSACNLVFGLLRTFGALAILHFVSPTPQAFFIWQALIAGLHVITLALMLWVVLPKGESAPRFDGSKLQQIKNFAAGMSGISILAILLTQADKIVLSRILPLEIFGYYSLASQVANGLGRITVPIFQAYFPRMSQLVGKLDERSLIRTYHQGCQLMAIAVLPVAAMFVFFSREIMLLWQKNPETMENTYLPVSILMAGSGLNALITTPYALQLAHGRTKLHFYLLLLAVVLLLPLTVISAIYFGTVGAAAVWLFLNICFIAVEIPLIHKKILTGEKWKWYLEDFGLPLAAVLISAALCRFFFYPAGSPLFSFIELAAISGFVLTAAVFSSSFARSYIFGKFL